MKNLLSFIVIAAATVSVVACSKKDADTAPDAGVAIAVVDAAPMAAVDTTDAAAAVADVGDAAPPTSETYEKAASAAVTNIQTATAQLNELEKEIGN